MEKESHDEDAAFNINQTHSGFLFSERVSIRPCAVQSNYNISEYKDC